MDTEVLCLGGLLLPLLFPVLAGSQLQVFTAPSFQAPLGSRAVLPCRFDVRGPVALGSLQVTWYRWDERVAWFDKGQAQPRGRLLETDLQSGNASLSLAKVAVPDEGLYKCDVRYGAQQQQGSTTLRVVASPTISIQKQQVVGSTETSLLCDVGGFYPRDLDATWLRDGQVLDSSTHSSPQRNLDGTFSLTLTYTFTPAKSDTGSVFYCRVHHPALEQPLQAELALDVPGWGSMSKVEGPERCRLGQEVTLRCSMEGKIPADTAVTWERTQGEDRAVIQKDGPGAAPEHQPLLPALPPGWTPTEERSETCLTASLTFTPTVQDHGARVRCHFQHEAQHSSKEPAWWEIQVWGESLQVPGLGGGGGSG
ncbi:natural cytotoxicity triggering receptor 3 ligand 1 [Alligator mississippiensis]|uniref:Natural cytotoxicity triggering receptor 3 ligand 1 n=1 Tax=Alligator mississippiensis TaxID=8496 RepID=A0A151N3A0_ALLMI|nr:natural cytotoxicity triggering receptor 3 ligand 1 [Alligator mississippiensis]